MIFCGQCGQQLAPGDTRCPRCGAAIEPDALTTTRDAHPNAPTEEARSFLVNRSPSTNAQGPMNPPIQQNEAQQKLVLRPGMGGDNYATSAASDETSMMDSPRMGGAYPTAYPQQSATNYPPAGASYGNFPPQGADNFATRGSYTGFTQQGGGPYTPMPAGYPASSPYQPPFDQYQNMQEPAGNNSRGRSASLVIILIGLLFILSAAILFILQHNGVI
jgi:hypothetical protein